MTSTNDITHPHFPEEETQVCNGYVITEGLCSLPRGHALICSWATQRNPSPLGGPSLDKGTCPRMTAALRNHQLERKQVCLLLP